MFRGGLFATMIVLSLLLGGGRARSGADPGTVLEYIRTAGAEQCPDRAAVRAAVAERLGYDPFSERGGRVLRCEITRDRAGLRSQIEMFDAGGKSTGARTLTSHRGDCSDLVPALLLVLSLAAPPPGAPGAAPADTPPLAAAPPAPPSGQALPARSPAKAPPSATASATATSEPREPLLLRVGLGVIGSAGALPAPSWGGTMTAGLARGGLALSLEGRVDAPASRAVPGGGQVEAWIASLALVPCAGHGAWMGCAVAGGGVLHGAGQGVPRARTASTAWFLAGARLAWQVDLGARSALSLHGDLLAAPLRAGLQVGDAVVWTTPLVSAAVGLSLVHSLR